jgi:hypothetical protein
MGLTLIWKNLLLLTLGGILVFSLESAQAVSETNGVESETDSEECVINEDDYYRAESPVLRISLAAQTRLSV